MKAEASMFLHTALINVIEANGHTRQARGRGPKAVKYVKSCECATILVRADASAGWKSARSAEIYRDGLANYSRLRESHGLRGCRTKQRVYVVLNDGGKCSVLRSPLRRRQAPPKVAQ